VLGFGYEATTMWEVFRGAHQGGSFLLTRSVGAQTTTCANTRTAEKVVNREENDLIMSFGPDPRFNRLIGQPNFSCSQ